MARALAIFEVALVALVSAWVGLGAPLAWLLRDGLGPRAVESHGAAALARTFDTLCWGPGAIALAAATVVVALARRRARAPRSGGT